MKITNTFYLSPLRTYSNLYVQNNKNETSIQKPVKSQYASKIFAYQDFNISFTGRTPEDFYAQDFNRENMPKAMKTYLNYDYEQRQHIPPEQMMGEVFKHLDKAENLMDVPKLYPHKVEPLFDNLHPLRIKPQKGILSEIKVARGLSDAPLLKDGSDDFGLYLLKKIYKEGKTLKEISKDFLEKDINSEYKGFITAPIDYSTTSAYGIKFPNNAFWHSFISTRDDYKAFFVTLPKNTIDPNRIVASESNSGTTSKSGVKSSNVESIEKEKQPRKYTIKKYQKEQIVGDIKDAKGDIDGIKRKVVKRFRKDDPEASFIVKYLSPIMTVAAERIHLSEEMRYFTENEREKGMDVQGKSMFERFWKANPQLLNDYSKSIVDTIEMFEDRYGAGGMVPINNDFEPINSNTENKKVIDYVTPDFIELLDYTKEIEPARNIKYAEHDRLQQEWETYFEERYGELVDETNPVVTDIEQKNVLPADDAINKVAKLNPGAKFYTYVLDDGTKISFAVNLQETTISKLKSEYVNMPNLFVSKYTKFFLNHPKANEKLLLSLVCSGKNIKELGDLVGNRKYSEDELDILDKNITNIMNENFYSADELSRIMREIYTDFEMQNPKFMEKVKQAIMEYSTRLVPPENDYLKKLISERYSQMEEDGVITNGISNAEKNATYSAVYEQAVAGINAMKCHNIVYLDSPNLEAGLSFLRIGNVTEDYQSEMDKIMRQYSAPLTVNERNKILRVFMNIMLNMEPKETESFNNTELSGFFKASMESLKLKENLRFKKEFGNLLLHSVITPENTTLRYLLDPNADENLKGAKVEIEISKLMQKHIEVFKMLASLNEDILDMYVKNSNPELYNKLKIYKKKQIYNILLNKLNK